MNCVNCGKAFNNPYSERTQKFFRCCSKKCELELKRKMNEKVKEAIKKRTQTFAKGERHE